MGYFQHGSTIVVLATSGLALAPNVREGARIRMGEPLMNYSVNPGHRRAVPFAPPSGRPAGSG